MKLHVTMIPQQQMQETVHTQKNFMTVMVIALQKQIVKENVEELIILMIVGNVYVLTIIHKRSRGSRHRCSTRQAMEYQEDNNTQV